MKKTILAAVALGALASLAGSAYEANWESLDKRPVPQWWKDAKFGVFVHWGVYSVPAYAPYDSNSVYTCYAEWYQGRMIGRQGPAGQKEFLEHHAKYFGGAPYANFVPQFNARYFNAADWATLFRKAGAKYAMLTSKHHDGYALWPSAESPYYNAAVSGPGRDIVGEFGDAMRAAGLHFGCYYSLIEYANPAYTNANVDVRNWSRTMNIPQMKELVEKYGVEIVWADGEWEHTDGDWCSVDFLKWLFNDSRMKDTVVVNDRWGAGCRGKHGGHYTTEYGNADDGVKADEYLHPWEECQGMGRSFGYNRFERTHHYKTPCECVRTLVDVVSRGGNLLLDIGPSADGLIPVVMEERLLAMGEWLAVNGDAIYATTLWADADRALTKRGVYFTKKGSDLYAICFTWPEKPLRIARTGAVKDVTLLGSGAKVGWKAVDGGIEIAMPRPADLPCEHAWTFKIFR